MMNAINECRYNTNKNTIIGDKIKRQEENMKNKTISREIKDKEKKSRRVKEK